MRVSLPRLLKLLLKLDIGLVQGLTLTDDVTLHALRGRLLGFLFLRHFSQLLLKRCHQSFLLVQLSTLRESGRYRRGGSKGKEGREKIGREG